MRYDIEILLQLADCSGLTLSNIGRNDVVTQVRWEPLTTALEKAGLDGYMSGSQHDVQYFTGSGEAKFADNS
jgi:hypothetical protein